MSSGCGDWVRHPDLAEERVEQDGELVQVVLGGRGQVAQDPVPVNGSGEAGQPTGDLLLDLRGPQAAFGVIRGGWDVQVVHEPQDVVGPVAEGFQQGAGLGFAGPVAVAGGVGQPGQHAVPQGLEEFGAQVGVDLVGADVAGEVRLVDQPAQGVGDLAGPHGVGVGLAGAGQVSQQVLGAQLVDDPGEGLVVVEVVPVVDHDGAGCDVGQHGGLEGVQVAVTEQEVGVERRAGDQQVLLGLLPTRAWGLRADPQRGLVHAHHPDQGDQGPDPLVGLPQRFRGPGEQAVHEPHGRFSAGQRGQYLTAALGRQVMDDHEEHRPRLKDRPVLDFAGPGAVGPGGGVHPPAPASDRVLVVLRDCCPHGGDLDLLEGVHHAQIGATGQVRAARTSPVGEPVPMVVRAIGPGQVRSRRALLLAPRPFRRRPVLALRWPPAGFVVQAGRHRGVAAVARQQVFQLRHLVGQFGDPVHLRQHESDQLIAGQILQIGHTVIKTGPRPSRNHRHADPLTQRRQRDLAHHDPNPR